VLANGKKPVRVSISQNRGNFGNGTKNEYSSYP
jgi:hypothetical protein